MVESGVIVSFLLPLEVRESLYFVAGVCAVVLAHASVIWTLDKRKRVEEKQA